MSRAVLSVGSNLGDRRSHLQSTVDEFADFLVAVSPIYETVPWGPIPQDDFLNVVLIVDDPSAGPREWLIRGQELERSAGRERSVRWGPRSLDVDIVQVSDATGPLSMETDDLIVPHPRAAERAFVLVPWSEVEPDAVLGGRPITELLAELDESDRAGVRRRDDLALTVST